MSRKHITEKQKMYLEAYLDGMTINGIAEKYGKSQSTISRVIHACIDNGDKTPLHLRKRRELVEALNGMPTR